MENNQEIERVLQEGYNLEIGVAINDSIDNFKKSFLLAGVAMFLYALVMGFFGITLFYLFFGSMQIGGELTKFNFLNMDITTQIGTMFLMFVISSISSIITAGFYRLFFKSAINESIELGDVFYYFKSSSHIKELILIGIIIGGFNFVVSNWLNQYMVFSGSLLSYFIYFCTIFAIPLIIFKNCSAIQALQYSVKLVFKDPITIFILVLIAAIISFLGIIALCIGILFTISYMYCMIFTMFDKIFPYNRTSPLDEIGKSF